MRIAAPKETNALGGRSRKTGEPDQQGKRRAQLPHELIVRTHHFASFGFGESEENAIVDDLFRRKQILAGGFALDFMPRATNNDGMVIPGQVHNGVVVLEGESALPEGAAVTVTYPALSKGKPVAEKRRIQVPLVRTDQPGSVQLTGARIAEILDEEDASGRH